MQRSQIKKFLLFFLFISPVLTELDVHFQSFSSDSPVRDPATAIGDRYDSTATSRRFTTTTTTAEASNQST